MGLLKNIGRSSAVQATAAFAIQSWIRFVHVTSRWSIVGDDIPQRFWNERKPFIIAGWHGRILMLAYAWPRGRQPLAVLISRHRDGEILARTMRWFGVEAVRGSTDRAGAAADKGGRAALRAMVRLIKDGTHVGITPDGPRGPGLVVSDGIVAVAKLSGVPVVPLAYSTKRRRVFDSWDRFVLARPFTRGVLVWGAPISVPEDARGAALEAARQAIEDGLNAAAAEADRRTGHDPAEIRPPATHARMEMASQA